MHNAIFYLTSPLQILCGIEAQKHFKINDATYILVTEKQSRSHDQMIELAKNYNLNYKVIHNDNLRGGAVRSILYAFYVMSYVISPFTHEYVFLGDATEMQLTLYSIFSLRRRGNLIYLDDGVGSIDLIDNGVKLSKISTLYSIVKRCVKFRDKIFFTTYYEIVNTEHKLIPNKFENFRQMIANQKERGVSYVIGPPVEEYCGMMSISREAFVDSLINVFKHIRRCSSDTIIYIPHRRDDCETLKQICISNNVYYKPLMMPVEIYMINEKTKPSVIYGYSSSALYTLKILYPDCSINSLYFDNINDERLNQIDSSFERKGIKIVDAKTLDKDVAK